RSQDGEADEARGDRREIVHIAAGVHGRTRGCDAGTLANNCLPGGRFDLLQLVGRRADLRTEPRPLDSPRFGCSSRGNGAGSVTDAREAGGEAIEVALGDWIELVVVALCAAHGEAQEGRAGGGDDVFQVIRALLPRALLFLNTDRVVDAGH